MKLLTQDEVQQLPIGTEIVVIWSGGNGPHNYKVYGNHNGLIHIDNCYHDILDNVGAYPLTQVWVRE